MLCTVLGKTPVRINKWARRGMPRRKRGRIWVYDVAQIIDWVRDYQRELDSAQSDITADTQEKKKHQTDYWKEKHRQLRRINDEEEGRSVRVDDVRAVFVEIGRLQYAGIDNMTRKYGTKVGKAMREMIEKAQEEFNQLYSKGSK